ncbi:MAG: tyrosine recombinase [Chloroflexi bacterium]|jgi:integrase/recombinase XerD|uniref:Tyrosine recombinase n=1 Tax=Candidatus Thermofonsia Clade 3 bacterium TaxID=2364212 RepID=A0A2M8QA88_9CHLR|nr:tyrosine recombinase [Candidatus Roseilinea sp. NK_OTU-006]PJF46716.1 MAG: tyrosine recombinase [Candidatus Thermofonsia Clade 3 bacterium]RMG65258.1 MAG: tyrosine recombinase [Chloroflexota bacterium]
MEWRSTVDEFLASIQTERGASVNTIMAYRNDLVQLINYLSATLPQDTPWSNVTTDILEAYVQRLTEQNYTASTIARKVAALKTFFHWLSQRGLVTEDPTLRLRSPRVEKRMPRLLSEEEVNRLFESASKILSPRSLRDRALLEVIYATGMRVSEAISLRLDDVDLEANTVRCAGRGARQRTIPLTAQASAALRAYLEHARGAMVNDTHTDFVFISPLGGKLTRQAVWQLTRQYAQEAGIEGELTPHTLRHSRAAHMLNSGEDIRRVQEWLGHANLATTQMYRPRQDKENKLVPASS